MAVGNEKIGPTPQIMPFGLAGVREDLRLDVADAAVPRRRRGLECC